MHFWDLFLSSFIKNIHFQTVCRSQSRKFFRLRRTNILMVKSNSEVQCKKNSPLRGELINLSLIGTVLNWYATLHVIIVRAKLKNHRPPVPYLKTELR